MASVYDFFVCADESGIQANASWSLILGYFGKPRPWVRFERRWERVLRKHDVRDFHAKDYFAFAPGGKRVGKYVRLSDGKEASYGDWPQSRHESFFGGLLRVIKQGDVQPLGIAVDVAAWNALAYGEQRFLTGGHIHQATRRWISSGAPSRVYFFLFQNFLVQACNRAGKGRRVLLIFDDHEHYKPRALELTKEVAELEPEVLSSLGGVHFYPRHVAPGIQAADLNANCWHRYFTSPNKLGRERTVAMEVLTAQHGEMPYCDARGLEVFLSQLPDDVRDKLRRETKPGP